MFCKYVFIIFNVEKYYSQLVNAIGRIDKICRNLKIEGNINTLHF
jgi:hypothetical protein